MFNRILVPLDGSTLAERAIPHAEQFARIFGSSIILLQVLEPTSYHENPKAVDPLSWQIRKAEADAYMQGIAIRTRENLGENAQTDADEKKSRVDYFIREGKTAENIVNFAHTENIDLLVISTHGSGGLSRWNISSVTQKVINLIYLPVLIVRAYHQPGTEDARIHYRRILLPIDSSRRAECALPAGIALARGEMPQGLEPEANTLSPQPSTSSTPSIQTKLILAAVIKPPELPIPEPHPAEIEQLSEKLIDVSRQAVSSYLNEMKERLSVDCETCVLENKSVSSAIEELASQEEDIDLVVLCAHGYSGQSTWPYGSVARNYMEHGAKPVLVIQDVPRSQVQPTAAEIAAEKTGRR
jgi:nucleotide-binding universal stress UspA family protein